MSEFRYFRESEFHCNCCGKGNMKPAFMEMIEYARGRAKTPFIITSGYRCSGHNASIGAKPTSSHVLGLAADIRVTSSRERYVILQALVKAGFSRIGVADDFIHVDTDNAKTRGVVWLY